jgi:hypothetical protein
MQSEDSMSTKTRRSYTEAFKEEAVRLVRESGHPVARDVGRWRKRQQLGSGSTVAIEWQVCWIEISVVWRCSLDCPNVRASNEHRPSITIPINLGCRAPRAQGQLGCTYPLRLRLWF